MKYDLTDTTFLLIIRLDTIERLENILTTSSFILEHFETNINVCEISYHYNGYLKKLLHPDVEYQFVQDDDPILYRTKYINKMVEKVVTPYVSIWDVDVIAPVQQIKDAVDLLRKRKADFVYPYEKLFLDTSSIIRNIFLKNNNDIQILMTNQQRMCVMYAPNPVGGAFFCNTNSYKKSGIENDKFYGWGVEDGERYRRWQKKGFHIRRISGPLFHLTHPRGINSTTPHFDHLIVKKRLINTPDKI